MLDYERVVEDIQNVLYSLAPVDAQQLQRLAGDYQKACDEANARLHRCAQLQRQGLRSEALQLCDQEPNLLDVVARLDFPELPQWMDLVNEHGAPGPPALMVDVAAELNEAYAAEQPLAQVLARHRLLALARAPLSARLLTLRQIAARDPGNAIWREDLQTYEQARLAEIEKEALHAFQQDRFVDLADLYEELQSQTWESKLPREMVGRIGQWYHEKQVERARQGLNELQQRLHDAFEEMDPEAGRRARSLWDECVGVVQPPHNDDVVQRALPALEWLDQQDAEDDFYRAFDQALDELRRQVAGAGRAGPLEAAYAVAARFDLVIPADLERQYREAVRDLKRQALLNKAYIGLGITLAVVLVVAIVASTVRGYRTKADAENAAGEIKRLLGAEGFDAGRQYVADLRDNQPALVYHQTVAAAIAEFEEADKERSKRRRLFEQLMSDIQMTEGETELRTMLGAARRQVITAADIARIDELEKQLDDGIQSELAKVQLEVEHWKGLDGVGLTDAKDAIAALKSRVTRIRAHGSAQQERAAILSELATLEATVARHAEAIAGERELVKQLVDDPTSWPIKLEEYLDRYNGVGRLHRDAKSEAKAVAGLHLWNEITKQLASTNFVKASPLDVAQLLQDYDLLSENFKGYPQQRCFSTTVISGLRAIAARIDHKARKNIALQLLDELTRDYQNFRDTHLISVSQKGQYCVTEDVQLFNSPTAKVTFTFLLGFGSGTSATGTSEALSGTIRKRGTAPHCALLDTVAGKVEEIGQGTVGWDRGFTEALKMVLDARSVHPVIRVDLLKRLAKTAITGSSVIANQLNRQGGEPKTPYQAFLERAATVSFTAHWLDPQDPSGQKATLAATGCLEQTDFKIGAVEAAIESLEAQKYFAVRPEIYLPAGILVKDRDDQWYGVFSTSAPGEAALYSVRETGNGTVTAADIGWYDSGNFRPHRTNRPVVSGQPVFVKK